MCADATLPGVTVVGDLRADLGTCAGFRANVTALRAADIPLSYREVALQYRTARPVDYPEPPAEPLYNIAYVHLNGPEFVAQALPALGAQFLRERYVIAYWMIEAPLADPEPWQRALPYIDEIWTASAYTQALLQQTFALPVYRLPHPVSIPEEATITRPALDLPDGFCFFFAFDARSTVGRKNPFGVIDAFRKAFDDHPQPPHLVLKVNGLAHFPALRQALREAAQHPQIHLLERYLPSAQMDALYQLTDCYVSLHRSEGFGLGIAQAMAAGKPVVATGWSGNMDFMTPQNSLPVAYDLVPITRAHHRFQEDDAAIVNLYPPGSGVWAEPHIDDAATRMRQMYDGQRSTNEVADDFDLAARYHPAAIGRAMRQHLAAIDPSHDRRPERLAAADLADLEITFQRWNAARTRDLHVPGRDWPLIGVLIRVLVRVRDLGRVWGALSHLLAAVVQVLRHTAQPSQRAQRPALPYRTLRAYLDEYGMGSTRTGPAIDDTTLPELAAQVRAAYQTLAMGGCLLLPIRTRETGAAAAPLLRDIGFTDLAIVIDDDALLLVGRKAA